MFNLEQAMHAADLARLRAGALAVLSHEVANDPDIVSLAVTITHETDGLMVIEAEYRDRAGHAVGGFGL